MPEALLPELEPQRIFNLVFQVFQGRFKQIQSCEGTNQRSQQKSLYK